jgi:hypothetical protein
VRGDDEQSGHLFSYLSPEQRVPADHPLRAIRTMTDDALARLSPRFETMYARQAGRRSRRSISSAPCCSRCCTRCGASACSWSSSNTTCYFAGLSAWGWTTPAWTPTTFTKIGIDCSIEGDIARAFFKDVAAVDSRRTRGCRSPWKWTVGLPGSRDSPRAQRG